MDPALSHRPWLRRLIGLLILWHILAVTVAPFAVVVSRFGPRFEPPSGGPPRPGVAEDAMATESTAKPSRDEGGSLPVILRCAEVAQPYLDVLYINHGYSFFAPEPGASDIMQYEVKRPNGTTVRGRLPDIRRHGPRLLYHRYFMLASQSFELEQAITRLAGPGSTSTLAYAIARHLMEVHGGDECTLRLFRHRLLWPEEVLQGKSPAAPDTYMEVGAVTYPPTGPPFEELRGSEQGGPAQQGKEGPP
jgi:hypothetical protein